MFVRNCWYVAGWDHELVAGQIISRSIINEVIALYRAENGSVVALEDRCCHRFAPLSRGRLEGSDLRCMYHGLKFNSAGVCIEIPGQDQIPAKARVKTYPVIEKHSWIWVWMGDPALADPALIPPAVGFDDPKWTLRCGQMDYKANYLLINDNLTDFSHLSYVHANSFGATEEWARTRPKIIRMDRGIRVQRWVSGNATANREIRSKEAAALDLWQSYDYLVPGILLMYTANFAAGSAAACNYEAPSPDMQPVANENFTSQAITPMSDTTSRYFYSWGPLRGPGSDAQAEAMLKVADLAFTEDRVMIEAQQEVIDRNPGKEVLTSADVGPVQMRGVIERLIKMETAAAPRSEVA